MLCPPEDPKEQERWVENFVKPAALAMIPGTRTRALLKALTYRLANTAVTMLIVRWLAGEWLLASMVGLMEFTVKLVGYYLHERLWAPAKTSRPKPCQCTCGQKEGP